MKIIISHDVDNITTLEHTKDLIIPKAIVRGCIELFQGYITTSELTNRFKNIINNKLHNLEELMTFDKVNSIPSTFFVGVSNGKGLNYRAEDAKFWINKILNEGFSVGTHGIAFNCYADIENEYKKFRNLSGLDNFGIRIHYLRNSKETLKFLNQTGYIFDTTLYEFKNPYKIGRLWEFPLHIMDGYIINKNAQWQRYTLEQSKEETKKIITDAFNKGINYFTVLFHDNYFSDSFRTWKEWYIWLINYLKNNNFKFTNYNQSIEELESI